MASYRVFKTLDAYHRSVGDGHNASWADHGIVEATSEVEAGALVATQIKTGGKFRIYDVTAAQEVEVTLKARRTVTVEVVPEVEA